jgi:outer membrane protein, heavy metal efflux system
MTPSRVLVIPTSIGIVLGLAAGDALARDAEPWPAPRPLASDLPAFRAPADPPESVPPPAPPPREPEAPLGLQDALALALLHNPLLADFSFEVRESEARALQDRKPPNPELELRAYRLDQGADSDTDTDPDEGRFRVILSQRFELGGKGGRRGALRDRESELAGWDYEAQRLEVYTAVSSQFAAVLGAQRRVGSWNELVVFLETLQGTVTGLVETGALRSLEVHEVARRLGEARIELAAAHGDLQAARFHLAATWGAPVPRFTEATGDLEPPAALPPIEVVLDRARQSPPIARWDAELARSEAQLSLARADRVPDLRIGAGVRWEDDPNVRDYLVDVEVALPILDRKQGDRREAGHAVARARAGMAYAAAAHGAVVAEAYYAVQAGAERAQRIEREVLPAARAILQSQERGVELGPTSLDDLLDARRDLARTEDEHAQALVDYHQARALLEGLVGSSVAGGS